MKLIQALILAAIALTLAACNSNSNEEQKTNAGSAKDSAPSNAQSAIDHGVKDKSDVGFEMAGGNIEQATNIPEKEKTAIIDAFNEYMDAFNEEDIDSYMNTISKNPEGFNNAEERSFVLEKFKDFDTKRTAENTTIIKYDGTNANVFADIHIALEQPSSGAKLNSDGRQVTVFVKEDGKWLITSVYYMTNASK